MSAEDRIRLPVDYMLDELQIRDLLGSGGFGITYLAYDWREKKYVAVKEYSPFDLASRGADGISIQPRSAEHVEDFTWGLKKFIDEAMCLAAFEHEAIVNVSRFLKANGTAYIVMEFVQGTRLSDWLESNETKQLSERFVRKLLEPILDGLEQVHSAGFLHRDIKPSNIMIRAERMEPVLIDFGSARQAVAVKSRDLKAVASRHYAPPEQYSQTKELGAWTDIYALACVAYQCLTGDRPPDSTDRLNGERILPLAKRMRSLASPAFLLAIDHGMELDSNKRPRSVVEWRAALFGGEIAVRSSAIDQTIDFVKSQQPQTPQDIAPSGAKPANQEEFALIIPTLDSRKSTQAAKKKQGGAARLYMLLVLALVAFGGGIALLWAMP